MPKATKTVLITGAVVIAAVVAAYLYVFPKPAATTTGEVPCLKNGIPLTQHLHPLLHIFVGTVEESIPANIGLSPTCERAVHTHSDDVASGTIHVESQDSHRYTLGNFFAVWGKPIERDGYDLSVTVDGAPFAGDPSTIELTDGQKIVFTYAIPRR
ncbi:MAG: hypothetical protein UY63_C0014G0001 [Parcubacteria group bacterium GW2011_GWA2_51_10]|nr:MAG: hypothetical protein UY63_C0014G0001 [Parcubacteria group bacterium GW2011_GWA2_51_10]